MVHRSFTPGNRLAVASPVNRSRAVAAWMPKLIAYREELRRAVQAVEVRRLRSLGLR